MLHHERWANNASICLLGKRSRRCGLHHYLIISCTNNGIKTLQFWDKVLKVKGVMGAPTTSFSQFYALFSHIIVKNKIKLINQNYMKFYYINISTFEKVMIFIQHGVNYYTRNIKLLVGLNKIWWESHKCFKRWRNCKRVKLRGRIWKIRLQTW